MVEPETTLTLETPGGLVTIRCACENGRVTRVTTTNVPCFVEALEVPVTVEGLGVVTCDICYGGAFFALVEAASVGLEIRPEQAREIVELGERIKAALRAGHHPRSIPCWAISAA